MMEKMAGQVRDLKSSSPLRPFNPNKLKILCVGNCVVNKMSTVFGRSFKVDSLFVSNLYNWGNYEEQSFRDRVEEADIVVALHGKPHQLRHSVEDLQSIAGDKLHFIPSVWLDGACSFEAFSIKGQTSFFGVDEIIAQARETSFEDAHHKYLVGELSTNPQDRFAQSIAALRAAEAEANTVPIADYIEATYRDEPVSICIGHPAPNVVRQLFEGLSERLDMVGTYRGKFNQTMMGNLALPKGRRSFTPYDVETLGLRYDHEPDWLLSSRSILQLVKNRFEKGGFDAA